MHVLTLVIFVETWWQTFGCSVKSLILYCISLEWKTHIIDVVSLCLSLLMDKVVFTNFLYCSAQVCFAFTVWLGIFAASLSSSSLFFPPIPSLDAFFPPTCISPHLKPSWIFFLTEKVVVSLFGFRFCLEYYCLCMFLLWILIQVIPPLGLRWLLMLHMMNSLEEIWYVPRGVPTYCQVCITRLYNLFKQILWLLLENALIIIVKRVGTANSGLYISIL